MNEFLLKIIRNPILIIAKKEVMDNIRNKWVIIITIIFTALATAGGAEMVSIITGSSNTLSILLCWQTLNIKTSPSFHSHTNTHYLSLRHSV